jgi:tetratricopeptide (TPR) repeat protein
VLSGRGDETVRILERTIAPDITRRGSTLWWWLFPLSEAYLYADRLEEARPLADRALAPARTRTARGDEAYALRLLGDIAMHSHPPAFQQAAAYYQPALTLANALGMRPLQAHCHRGLGLLYATTGQRQQARFALATAMALYRSMDMTFWLPETEAALARVEGSPGSIS